MEEGMNLERMKNLRKISEENYWKMENLIMKDDLQVQF